MIKVKFYRNDPKKIPKHHWDQWGSVAWHFIEEEGSTLDEIMKPILTSNGISDRLPPHEKPEDILEGLNNMLQHDMIRIEIEGLTLKECPFCDGTGVQYATIVGMKGVGHPTQCRACNGDKMVSDTAFCFHEEDDTESMPVFLNDL